MADKDELAAVVDRYLDRMNAGDKDGWLALFGDDAVVEDPVGMPPHEGREAIAALWDVVRSLSDELRLERTGPVRVAGGEAAFPMQAHSVTGGSGLVVDIIDVFRFDEQGRIASMRAFWDPSEMRPE